MNAEEFFEVEPPSAEKAARRALALSVVCCRAFVEGDKGHPDRAWNLARDAREWLSSLHLEGELTEWERGLLDTRFGAISDQDRIDATWLSEAVAVFAWALGARPEPALDEQCDPAAESGHLGFLAPAEETALNNPALRSVEELAAYNEFLYTVHWRVRDCSLLRTSCDFRAIALKAWGEPVHKFGLELKNDDLALDGVPITELRESDFRRLDSIVRERHRASNWLIGHGSADFYEVPTDT